MAKHPATSGHITSNMLSRAKNLCSARGALPKDWDDWFPGTIPLLVKVQGINVTVQHILDYAEARMLQTDDPTRLLEAAQCLALIHYLGNPDPKVVVVSVHG